MTKHQAIIQQCGGYNLRNKKIKMQQTGESNETKKKTEVKGSTTTKESISNDSGKEESPRTKRPLSPCNELNETKSKKDANLTEINSRRQQKLTKPRAYPLNYFVMK